MNAIHFIFNIEHAVVSTKTYINYMSTRLHLRELEHGETSRGIINSLITYKVIREKMYSVPYCTSRENGILFSSVVLLISQMLLPPKFLIASQYWLPCSYLVVTKDLSHTDNVIHC